MAPTFSSGLILPNGQPASSVYGDGTQRRAARARVSVVSVPEGPDGSRAYTYAELYRRQPALFSVLNKLVRHMARVPIRVYKPTPARGVEEVTDPNHKLVRLLARPAPRKGRLALVQWLMFPPLLHGNGLIGKARPADGQLPDELMPLQWPMTQGYRQQAGWIDKWLVNEDGLSVLFDAEDVLHTAWMGPDDVGGEIGVSPLEALAQTLAIEDAAQRQHGNTFRNSARPEGVFTLPPEVELTDKLEASLRAAIDRLYRGVDNAGRTAILGGGAQWKATGLSAVETALLETRALTRLEVCMAYDVSPTVIGDLEHASQRGNVAELNQDFYGNTLGPWFALGDEVLTRQLVHGEPEWEDEGLVVAFDPSEFLRGDAVKWAAALNMRVNGGGLTVNERRRMDGLPDFDDPRANEPLIADNNVHPLSMVGDDDAAEQRRLDSAAQPAARMTLF